MELGLAPADYPFSCTGISGYSGGGKTMIAEYESADRPAHSKLDAPKRYGLGLAHKHLPEMQTISGLAHTPMFVPVVCDYYCGMQVLVQMCIRDRASTLCTATSRSCRSTSRTCAWWTACRTR